MEGSNSARSARNRTQVGTTNRTLNVLLKATGVARGESDNRRGGGTRGGSSTGVAPRSVPSSNGARHRVDAKDRDSLSTSRSMPSLETSKDDTGLISKGENGRISDRVEAFLGNQATAADGVQEEERPRAPADDFYMSSTQMSYMSGLHAPESKVPVLDPYLHGGLRHERWINRASQRLGHLASLKYGSIREFFRLYDANCDGVLDFDEFSKGITMCQLDHLFPRSLQRALFDRIDGDKSGTIELNEFSRFLGRGVAQGVPAAGASAWQKQEQKRKTKDVEARSVQLQPIQDYKSQRIKNKLSHCLNKAVPNASAGLADNRTMFLKKQFAFLHDDAATASRGISAEDLVNALGPRGINLGVDEEDVRLLMKEMDTNGDGSITLKEFASFLNLDDHDPLYQPLFDSRRRNVNILQAAVDAPAPVASPDEAFFKKRADRLHEAAVPSNTLDAAVRLERSSRDASTKGKHIHRSARPESPPWTVDDNSVAVSMPSSRTVVDVWNLPPPTRHLSSVKRSLTSSMRALPRSTAEGMDGVKTSFASDGGPFAVALPQEALSSKKKTLSSLSSSQALFSSLEEERLQDAAAGAMARSRKVAKPTWADIGHGGIGDEAGTDDSSSYYVCPGDQFTTTNAERYAPLIREKKIEKGQRSAWFYRQRPGDSAASASLRQDRSEHRTNKIKEHLERISLSVKSEEVAARIKGGRRVRGKARCRLRYNKWVNSMDNWLSNEAPKLADFDKRQFPEQNIRSVTKKLLY